MTDASVNLWGRRIGAVSWDAARHVGVFQYDPEFLMAGIELSPIVMPVREETYVFPVLGRDAFKGLPGLLADALPDRFGTLLIDAWLATSGRSIDEFSPVDRLCYIGSRGMGALEFEPAIIEGESKQMQMFVDQLLDLANSVLNDRMQLTGRLGSTNGSAAIEEILNVGTSAGGARAKALLAWNPRTDEFRSGQVDTEEGFQHWILKFDGITNNRDRELADPQGYGKIEYAYHLMARDAGLEMSECRLHHEGGRSHFMTRRFDRDAVGRKHHMQSLGALQHFDYNMPGAYTYEQAMSTIHSLGLGMAAVEQQYRRAVFNIVARNQDDHVKNIAFLMDRTGNWRLSPAYDVTYSYNSQGDWTGQHQMSVAGKRDNFDRGNLMQFAKTSGIKSATANRIIDDIRTVVGNWPQYADTVDIPEKVAERIERTHRVASLAAARVSMRATPSTRDVGDV